MLALDTLDPTVRGIIFLVAVVLFVVAAIINRLGMGWLIPAGLAGLAFVFMWDAFVAAG